MTKTLYGIKDNKIIIVDGDVSDKAKKQCFKDGCTSVIVGDKTRQLMDAFINETPIDMDMFTGVVL